MRSFNLLTFFILSSVATHLCHAGVILSVDPTDTGAVLFDTTAAVSEDIFTDESSSYGITLLGFFSENHSSNDFAGPFSSGGINVFNSPAGTTRSTLGQIFVGDWSGGWTSKDLNIYAPVTTYNFTMKFFDDETALTGSGVADLSGLIGFPTAGTSGNIVAGLPNDNNVIGQWQVNNPNVPEPSTAIAMSLLGVVGFAGNRRRRRQS